MLEAGVYRAVGLRGGFVSAAHGEVEIAATVQAADQSLKIA